MKQCGDVGSQSYAKATVLSSQMISVVRQKKSVRSVETQTTISFLQHEQGILTLKPVSQLAF